MTSYSSSLKPLRFNKSTNSASISFQNDKTIPIRKLMPTKMQEKREKGLCFNCDETVNKNHKSEANFLVMMTDDDQEKEEIIQKAIKGIPDNDIMDESCVLAIML